MQIEQEEDALKEEEGEAPNEEPSILRKKESFEQNAHDEETKDNVNDLENNQ